MKKMLVLVLVLSAFVFPLTAKTNLINFGYNIHGKYYGVEDLKLRSIGVDFIHLGGETSGFYSQVNPYFGMSFKGSGGTAKLSDYGESLFGSNFILGYGGDLNFGSMGLILGGGLFLDGNYYTDSIDYILALSTGLGFGANFYFQPGSGTFILNAGLSLAWRPYTYFITEYNSEGLFDGGKTNTNFNIGIGWITGGIGSKSGSTDW